MVMQFRPATREHAKARIALIGPSGSGKTKSALLIAQGLVGPNGRIGVIDTERGSASKYAGQGVDFDVLELATFAPATYVQAIAAAQQAGFDVLIVDSLSHAWMGKDGALEMVDGIAKRSQSQNSFVAWRDVTPHHNRLVDALVSAPMHLIVTMRSKMEYVLEQVDLGGGKTKTTPRKVGLAPIQRDGLEYEFDVVGDITLEHRWIISKTRCELFDEAIIEKPGVEFGEELLAWLNTGDTPKPRLVSVPEPEPAAERSTSSAARGRTIRHAGHSRGEPRRTQQQTPSAASSETPRTPTQPPAAVPNPEPCFSVSGKWANAAQWSGKPLRSAPLATLQEYDDALRDAIANPANKNRLRVLVEHRTSVAAAIKQAEPPPPAAPAAASNPDSDQTVPAAPEDDGWNQSGEGGQRDDNTTH